MPCFLTSHIEVAASDITVGGRTIKEGQAYIVSDLQIDPTGGGGGATTSLDLCKIASFNLNEQFRVYKIANTSFSLQGTDLVTSVENNIVASIGTDFIAAGITTQMNIQIISGNDQGSYAITEVAPEGHANWLRLSAQMTDTATNISWEITPEVGWEIDYSNAITANIAPGSNILRYLPFMGPGDHKGTFASVNVATPTTITVADGNLTELDNPVLVGEYIELKGGPDAGFYQIVSVAATQVTVVNASWSADQANLAWHIGKVSPHATVCRLHQVDGVNVVIPEENSVEVKIRSAIRDLADAQALDANQEDPGSGFTAVDLFNDHGAFLACYRLQTTASDGTGMPLDDRVIIHAKPWRGHTIGGELFYGLSGFVKYRGISQNPVFPMTWYRDAYRVEIAIARATRHQPASGDTCL